MGGNSERLVEVFYHQVWNKADEHRARDILSKDFRFRGSLGPEKHGQDGFIEYMHSIHEALGDYTCIIEDLVVTNNAVAAKMIFRGRHRARFFGIEPTGREISWAGAAFFTIKDERINSLWVLGDIDSVKQQLGVDVSGSFSEPGSC